MSIIIKKNQHNTRLPSLVQHDDGGSMAVVIDHEEKVVSVGQDWLSSVAFGATSDGPSAILSMPRSHRANASPRR